VVSASSASRAPDAATTAAEGARPAQPVADLTALTTQDDFLLELGEALGGHAAVRPVDTLDAALEAMAGSKRTQVLVIDARAVPDVPATVSAAHRARPQLAVLVFAESVLQKQLAALPKNSSFALLSTPIDPVKLRSVLERTIAAAVAAKASAAAAAPALPADQGLGALRLEAAPAEDHSSGGGKSRALLLSGIAAALALAAGGAYWYLQQPHSAPLAHALPAATAPTTARADNSIVQGKVDELLEKARLAMHERRFTEPSGDNALLYYRSAAAADSANGEAHDGLQRVAGVLAARFEEAVSGARFEEAALTLANFKLAAPGDARTGDFEQRLYSAELARALADGNIERASAILHQAQQSPAIPVELIGKWRTEIARRQEDARVQHLAGLVEDRIHDGRLNDGEDSASSYVEQLQASAAANPVTERVTHELIGAYLHKAREAALAKNTAEQDRWLAAARTAGMKPAEMLTFQKELSGARQKAVQLESEHMLQLARERVRDGRLTDPAQDSAAYYLTQLQSNDPSNAGLIDASHALASALIDRARAAVLAGKAADADLAQARQWGADASAVLAVQQLQAPKPTAATDLAALAANLKRTRAAPPDYPPNALAQHLTGSVTLQFTVDTHGETRDIHVVEASSPGLFDQAAINAIKHWRYAPMLVDGVPVAVPVTTRVRFELPK
jgi:TonB family protein